MEYREFGKTGIKISEIGYGAWGIGGAMWQGSKDDESLRALHRAIDLGLNFIDTALVYGNGHSENLVGKVIKERKEQLYVTSKIPPKNLNGPHCREQCSARSISFSITLSNARKRV